MRGMFTYGVNVLLDSLVELDNIFHESENGR